MNFEDLAVGSENLHDALLAVLEDSPLTQDNGIQ